MPAALLLLAASLTGLELRPVELEEEIRDARVVDVDADGEEDVVAVSKKHLFLLRGGRGPPVRRPAPPLTVLGRGLVGVVRDGVYRPVEDPFGEWKVGEPGPRPLLAGLGKSEPALLLSPGDVDGDGRDDPLVAARDGLHTPTGVLPLVPRADLSIKRNELFAVEYRIPVPVVGNWSGAGRELVFYREDEIRSYRGLEQTDRIPFALPTHGRTPDSVRRNHVLFRDVDRDGRLDLLVLFARGRTGLSVRFEATVRFFRGGRIYHHEKGGFFRPASYLKVDGALLWTDLLDLDGDGDLDLVLGTIETGLAAAALGQAPTHYFGFRFDTRRFHRVPAWRHKGTMDLAAFTEKPEPPVRFLPDLDGDGRPEALVLQRGRVALLEATSKGRFVKRTAVEANKTGVPSVGRTRAAVAHASGVLVAEDAE